MTMTEAWQAPVTAPASDAELAAIEAVIRDYYEGWYTGDADRMARALHPVLVKRCFGQGPDRTPELIDTTAAGMIAATKAGQGLARRGESLDIRFAEVGGGIASVNVFADHYVDFLHLVRTPDGWQIVNALWRWADGHGPRA
jgi:hypothetical protein